MGSIQDSSLLASVPNSNILDFYQKALFKYDDVRKDGLGIFQVLKNRSKTKLAGLRSAPFLLQGEDGCNWNPTKGRPMHVTEIIPCLYLLKQTICRAEWDTICGEYANLLGAGSGRYNNISAELTDIEAAMLDLAGTTFVNNLNQTSWFGYAGGIPDTTLAPFVQDLANSQLSASEQASLNKMIAVCDGWWAEITKRVQAGIADPNSPEGIAYVDSNNGTAIGNAINKANVTAFFDKMLGAASFELSLNQNAVFLVQTDIWRAYYDFRSTQTGSDLAWQFQGMEKTDAMSKTLEYQGFRVLRIDEWGAFDKQVGAYQTDVIGGKAITHSTNQRAILTIPQNLVVQLDTYTGRDSMLFAQQRVDASQMGQVDIFGAVMKGQGIKDPKMIVAAYNSSNTFI
jgi:hypothetical protein